MLLNRQFKYSVVVFYNHEKDFVVQTEVLMHKVGDVPSGLRGRNRDIIRCCSENGVLDEFKKGLLAIGEQIPEDLRSRFIRYIESMVYLSNPSGFAIAKYRRMFDGNVRFYKEIETGLVMVMYRRTPRRFVPSSELEPTRAFPRVPHEKVMTRHPSGALIPQGNPLFRAGLSSQIPDRGRPTPVGKLVRVPARN